MPKNEDKENIPKNRTKKTLALYGYRDLLFTPLKEATQQMVANLENITQLLEQGLDLFDEETNSPPNSPR